MFEFIQCSKIVFMYVQCSIKWSSIHHYWTLPLKRFVHTFELLCIKKVLFYTLELNCYMVLQTKNLQQSKCHFQISPFSSSSQFLRVKSSILEKILKPILQFKEKSHLQSDQQIVFERISRFRTLIQFQQVPEQKMNLFSNACHQL